MTQNHISAQLNGKGIAVTRPIDQAQKLNTLITAHGGTPISFSLIEIMPLTDYSVFNLAIAPLSTCDWAIFISSNAVQNAMPRVIQQLGSLSKLPNLRFAAIGPVTAKELGAFGIEKVLKPQVRFDSEALLMLPEMHNVKDQNIMLFRGVGGRELLADTLKARGANVAFAQSYQRINPQTNCLMLEQLWQNQQLHAIVVTSSEAMRHLLELAESADWVKNIVICVNHARVAEPGLALGLKVKVADASGDLAMLDLLLKVCVN